MDGLELGTRRAADRAGLRANMLWSMFGQLC
jgi:hypothetical protein